MVKFDPSMPLSKARSWLLARADDGAECPLCQQHVQVYRRRVHATMARDLIRLYQAVGLEWTHVATTLSREDRGVHLGDFAKLAYWGLAEEEAERRDDGGRAGVWRITPAGENFLLGHTTIAKYARVYNGRLLSLDQAERVTIRDALGSKFDYSELMAGV